MEFEMNIVVPETVKNLIKEMCEIGYMYQRIAL